MGKKIKCKKCESSFDRDLSVCPICGEEVKNKTSKYVEEKDQEVEDFLARLEKKDDAPIQEVIKDENPDEIEEGYVNPAKESFVSLFKFPSRELKVDTFKSIMLFLVGFVGIYVISFIVQMIIIVVDANLIYLDSTLAAINYGIYFMLLGVFLIMLSDQIMPILKSFDKPKKWFQGILYGVILILVSITINLIRYAFVPDSTSNTNQESVEAITVSFPILSLIVLGIIGPICEEFTYRVGLFSATKKLGRAWGYIICAIVFGFIHFSFDFSDTDTLINELLNLPSYMVAGLLLCYFYEKGGISASILAHCTNNLYSLIATLAVSGLIKV